MKTKTKPTRKPEALREPPSFYQRVEDDARRTSIPRKRATRVRSSSTPESTRPADGAPDGQTILSAKVVQSWDEPPGGETASQSPGTTDPGADTVPESTREEVTAPAAAPSPTAQQQSDRPAVVEAGTFRVEPMGHIPSEQALLEDVRHIRDPRLETLEQNEQGDLRERMFRELSALQNERRRQEEKSLAGGQAAEQKPSPLNSMDLIADVAEMTQSRSSFAQSTQKNWQLIKQTVVETARREWETTWQKGNLQEHEAVVRPALVGYWSAATGMKRAAILKDYRGRFMETGDEQLSDDALITKYFTKVAWSAAFISWIMQEANATPEFANTAAHVRYVADAKRNAVNQDHNKPVWAYDARTTTPLVGDIVVKERNNSGVTFANVDDGQHRASHGDIVVEASATSLQVIGGNTKDETTGKLHTAGMRTIQLNNGRLPSNYFAIVRIVVAQEQSTNSDYQSDIPTDSPPSEPVEQIEMREQGASRAMNKPASSQSAPAVTPGPQASRPCCILAPTISPLSSTSNLVEPNKLGDHRGSNEAQGLIYTGSAGFFDLGHVRDLCDMTKYVYDQIANSAGAPGKIQTWHGEATITKSIPNSDWVNVARAIAYDDSVGYEIVTYNHMTPGGHNSSFSPEDLCSNYLGTILAERALAKGGNFNHAVTGELLSMVKSLDAQSVSESLKAFDLINGKWVDFSGASSLMNNDYLKRRNFTNHPWKTGHSSDAATPAWVTAGVGTAQSYYDYENTYSVAMPKSGFAAEVSKIRTDAQTKHGADYDKP